MRFISALSTLAVLQFARAWPTNADRRSQCINFKPSAVDDVAIVGVTYYELGDLVNLTSYGGTVDSTSLDPFCRIQMWITTNSTTGNGAASELWLPDDWNSRLVGFGNGGWSGGPVYSSLSYDGANRGFAAFSTNTGHNSTSLDGSWAPGNPNAVVDFGWRAMHMTTVAAKNLTEQYYGDAPKKNYYLGCSTGGRQGIKEMTRFPDDFDGVVIGSPANKMAGLLPWEIRQDLAMLPVNSSSWITTDMWTVLDGVINNPPSCNFRPQTLTCRPKQDPSTCLNLDQLAALETIYTDYYNGDEYIFASYEPGGELLYPVSGLLTPTPFGIATSYYPNFILNTTWDYTTLNFSTIQQGFDINPGNMDTDGGDLLDFFNGGGKLLHYVGWSDELIAPRNSIRFYDEVSAYTTANSNLTVDDVYKLYTVPGMGHCSSGAGANAFGGEGQRAKGMPPLVEDSPKYDILMAMVDWIEQDTAPDYLIAASYVKNNATLGTQYTRKLCPYPQQGKFTGTDNTTYTSFECE
ncbi:feruloyl esterase-like protein [Pseudohyphozyma bogoriensis]|nr:feruloyl esterase-like protein [Pseudohyphozyma bogoriensis]